MKNYFIVEFIAGNSTHTKRFDTIEEARVFFDSLDDNPKTIYEYELVELESNSQ